MKNINFFQPYIEKSKFSGKNSTVLVGAGVFLLVLVLGFYGFNFYKIYALNKQIATMENEMRQPAFAKKVAKYEEVKRKTEALTGYGKMVEGLNNYVDSQALISSGFFSQINRAMPQNVFLQAASITPLTLDLQGVAVNRIAVAEYIHNLKGLDLFSEVYVSNINQEATGTGSMLFTLKCTVKGGANQ